MKKSIFTLVIMGLTIIMTSCNNPLNKKYSEDNFGKDLKEIVESKKADTSDMIYIAMYITKSKLLGENLNNKTYRDILDNAKELRKKSEEEDAEAKSLAEKAKVESEEKRQLFAKVLTVALYDKGYYEGDYQNYLTYEVAYENKSDKNIRAIKGSMLITDLFDGEIKQISLVDDSGIPAGKTVKMSYTSDYNRFRDEDSKLRSKDLKDLKVIWTPEKIIFEDGSTLE